jgi:DNA-binding NtrC family response regulator
VLKRFQEYAWPGNVQELATVIKRAAIVTRRPVIGVDEIGPMSKGGPVSEDRGEVESALARAASLALQERLVQKPSDATSSIFHDIVGFVESALVKEALSITNNNQVKASELLGVNRATLRKKALG